MDLDFRQMKGNKAFDEMIKDDVWQWVKPKPLVDTQWSDDNGKDRYPNSALDLAFVASAAKAWNPQCRVIVRDGDFPDSEATSDRSNYC